MNQKIRSIFNLGTPNFTTLTLAKKSLAGGASATTIFKGPKIPLGKTAIVKATVFTSAGTERGAYVVTAAVANKGGTVALVGTAVVDAFEDDSAHALTLVANNTDDTIDVQGTPDSANTTYFWGSIEVQFD